MNAYMKKGMRGLFFTVLVVSLPVCADLVGQWKFDMERGGWTPDATRNGFNGKLEGKAAIVLDPERGMVLELGGVESGDTVSFPKLAREHSLPERGGVTVMAWIKRNSDGKGGDAYDYIFYLMGEKHEQVSLSLNSPNTTSKQGPSRVYGIIEGDKPGNNLDGDQVNLSNREPVPDNTWVHVAVTFDRLMDRGFSYLNGKPSQEFDLYRVGDGVLNWVRAGIGEFGGRIDDLRYYDEVLSPEEIARIAKGRP